MTMRMEIAVLKMVEAAQDKNAAPEKVAKAFELALEKVASTTPVGEQALKIVQSNLLKDILREKLNIAVRLAKGPRAPRGTGAVAKHVDPLTKGLMAMGLDPNAPDDETEAPTKKTVTKRKQRKSHPEEVA